MKITKIDTADFASFSANTYVAQEGGDAFIIDCGVHCAPVFNYLAQNNLTARAVLLTHGHFDHCQSAHDFAEKNIKVYITKEDYALVNSLDMQKTCYAKFPVFKADFFEDGQELDLGGVKFRIMATAGHTAGSVCIIVKDYLFTGDTLFYKSMGRTDLFTGDETEIKKSLKKLRDLDFNYKILAGHDRETELFFEKQNNPFLTKL